MQGTEVKYQVWSCPKCPQLRASGNKAPRVLLAEDNTIDQINIRRLLENEGVEVYCVESGREAVDEAKNRDFNLILMDILMPELDGFEATRMIRDGEQTTGYGIPIFALTAYSLKAIHDKCRSVGMNGYLSKPVSARDLRKVCSLFYIMPALDDVFDATTGGVLPILDTEEALVKLGGVRALHRELVDLFVNKAPDLITNFLNLIHTGDTEEAKKQIHRLMTPAENIGARRIVYLCEHIQSSIDNDNLNDCVEWSRQLSLELELLLDDIHRISKDGLW